MCDIVSQYSAKCCMLVCERVGAGVSMHCVSFERLCVMQQIAEGGGEWVLPVHQQMVRDRGFKVPFSLLKEQPVESLCACVCAFLCVFVFLPLVFGKGEKKDSLFHSQECSLN